MMDQKKKEWDFKLNWMQWGVVIRRKEREKKVWNEKEEKSHEVGKRAYVVA